MSHLKMKLQSKGNHIIGRHHSKHLRTTILLAAPIPERPLVSEGFFLPPSHHPWTHHRAPALPAPQRQFLLLQLQHFFNTYLYLVILFWHILVWSLECCESHSKCCSVVGSMLGTATTDVNFHWPDWLNSLMTAHKHSLVQDPSTPITWWPPKLRRVKMPRGRTQPALASRGCTERSGRGLRRSYPAKIKLRDTSHETADKMFGSATTFNIW